MRLLVAALGLGAATLTLPSTPAQAQGAVPCAREGGYCRVPYPTRVIYGVPGRTTSVEVRGRGVPCSNEVFGDPAFGARKSCSFVARRGFEDEGPGPGATWRSCAGEDEFCDFRGRKRVRYGARGRFVEGVFRDGVDCDNETFGDPVPGIRKFCQIRE